MGTPLALAAVIEAFLDDRAARSKRGLQRRSRKAYHDDLDAWATVLAVLLGHDPGPHPTREITISDLTRTNVSAAYSVICEQNAVSTCVRRLGTLRLFAQWLILTEQLQVDPTIGIETPTRPERPPTGWTDDEVSRLLLAAASGDPRPDKRRWPARDYAICRTLVDTGVGAQVCAIRERDWVFDVTIGDALRAGRGRTERLLPLSSETVAALRLYRDERNAVLGAPGPDEQTFRLSTGAALGPSALTSLVETWIDRAGVSKPEGAMVEAFRHTFALGLLRAGVPPSAVQRSLGHADLSRIHLYLKRLELESQTTPNAT